MALTFSLSNIMKPFFPVCRTYRAPRLAALPFAGLLHNSPQMARLRKMQTAFICPRQRRFAFPIM